MAAQPLRPSLKTVRSRSLSPSSAPARLKRRAEPASAAFGAHDWEALVGQVEHGSPLVGSTMRLGVRVIELSPGVLRYQLAPGLPGDPAQEIRRALQQATGMDWLVEQGEGPAQPSLEERRAEAERAAAAALRRSPLVEATFAAFPAAEFVKEDDVSRGERNWSRSA